MNKLIKIACGFSAAAMLFAASPALAATPTLSLNNNGGDNITLTVNGADQNSSVQLNYIQPGSSLATTITNFGYTNHSGYFSTSFSASGYGINSGSQVYVTVNGQQSNRASLGGYSGGCTYNCGSPYGISLSQTNVNIGTGQTANVSINYGYGYGSSAYISSNSNPSVVSASVSSNSVTLYGLNSGSGNVSVCANNGGCATIYVTVSGGSVGSITFSPANPALSVGQTLNVTVNAPYLTGNFYISSNSNPGAATASLNGNTITLYGQNSGSTTINVCANNGSCSGLYVTVGSGTGGSLSLSQTSINLNVGQTAAVTAYNTSSIYISSNSNPAVASANIMGSTQININALSAGSTNIYVCGSNASQCATVNVGVYGGSSNLTFSQNNVTLVTGQSGSYYIYSNNTGSGGYYISSQSNSGAATASVSGSSLNIFAQSSGTNAITVCQYGSGNCGTFNVTVNGTGGSGSVWFSNSNVTMSAGQAQNITVYSSYGNASYYVSSNSNSYVATASISGSNLNITAQNPGNTAITVCANGNGCGTMNVTVNNQNSGGFYITVPAQPQISVGQYFSMQLQASGGSAPYTFTVGSGGLPNGVNLSASGQIFGTPTYAQTSTFTARAQDAYGRVATQQVTLNIGGSVLGSSAYKTGLIISENGTVYLVYKNTKSGFVSRAVFEGLGFNFGQVTNVGYSGISDSGYTIRTASASHPWGSWVKSGTTVYFVQDAGLIPVSDYAIFLNNGGEDRLVVQANYYDFRLPMLSVMAYDDARVK